jgi:hypothetical protein
MTFFKHFFWAFLAKSREAHAIIFNWAWDESTVKKEGSMPSFLNKNQQLGKVEAPIHEWCSSAMLPGVFTISTFPLHSRNV